MKWKSDDVLTERIAMAQIYELGLGSAEEIAAAFGTSLRTVYYCIQTFKEQGSEGLIKNRRGPKESWKINTRVRSKILYTFFKQGIVEYGQIRKRLEKWDENVSTMSIRQVLLENGLVRETSVFPEAETRARRYYSPGQRMYLDQLEQGDYNTYAGYSLEELCQTLFYFDVFSFRSMEDFKRVYPEEFGVLIGRTSSPSHFTIRRFLHKVRKLERGEELIEESARMYLGTGLVRRRSMI